MAARKFIKDFSQGDSFKIKISHNPTKDITGGSIVFVMRKRESDTTNILKVTHTIGNDPLDDPANGIAYLSVTAADTTDIPAGKYFGSVKRILGTEVFTVVRSDRDYIDLIEVYPNMNT